MNNYNLTLIIKSFICMAPFMHEKQLKVAVWAAPTPHLYEVCCPAGEWGCLKPLLQYDHNKDSFILLHQPKHLWLQCGILASMSVLVKQKWYDVYHNSIGI